jgi:hypothetical protein
LKIEYSIENIQSFKPLERGSLKMGATTLHSNAKILGVNGFGRIGKLTLWHHVGRKYFDDIIINIGRQPGSSLHDIAHYVELPSWA